MTGTVEYRTRFHRESPAVVTAIRFFFCSLPEGRTESESGFVIYYTAEKHFNSFGYQVAFIRRDCSGQHRSNNYYPSAWWQYNIRIHLIVFFFSHSYKTTVCRFYLLPLKNYFYKGLGPTGFGCKVYSRSKFNNDIPLHLSATAAAGCLVRTAPLIFIDLDFQGRVFDFGLNDRPTFVLQQCILDTKDLINSFRDIFWQIELFIALIYFAIDGQILFAGTVDTQYYICYRKCIHLWFGVNIIMTSCKGSNYVPRSCFI